MAGGHRFDLGLRLLADSRWQWALARRHLMSPNRRARGDFNVTSVSVPSKVVLLIVGLGGLLTYVVKPPASWPACSGTLYGPGDPEILRKNLVRRRIAASLKCQGTRHLPKQRRTCSPKPHGPIPNPKNSQNASRWGLGLALSACLLQPRPKPSNAIQPFPIAKAQVPSK